MTAEIAILNRTALAFAADSAATLSGPRGSKTYDSAEKIFELCRQQPIALMVFNNAEFMGVPLDVLVRKFRESQEPHCGYERLTDVWPAFLKFLENFPKDVDDEARHLSQFAFNVFNRIFEGANSLYFTQVTESFSRGRRVRRAFKNLDELAIDLAGRHRQQAEAQRLDGYLDDVLLEQFQERYGPHLDAIITASARGIDVSEDLARALKATMFAVIRSRSRSSGFTGFVFGGFGQEDLFPTLDSVELDGVYFDQVRVLVHETIDIDRRGVTAAIVPFAQKDMPQRFIYGLDDALQNRIERIVGGVVDQIVAAKPRTYSREVASEIRSAASASVRTALGEFKSESEQKLKSVVNFMSKRELAEIAYSLVELTSRKRRFSDDQETVGGPIDVAVLTRNEGFIWIRRKHYFDANLNPAYFVRNAEGRKNGHEPGKPLVSKPR
ncbi:hypothetical protein [Caulobacter sp.]|uniref:hypothetical protein n=1 Tax=Caulobacter sp. TaxID=78 RepID=UPI003BAEA58A